MSIAKIIGIIIAIPLLIFTLIPMFIQFWAEGLVTDAIMKAFGVNPLIAGLITICGLIVFIIAVFKVSVSILG